MESSELTGLGSKQIGYGRTTVVQSTPKQIDFFQQGLGCGWVYLATEGIISLASITESLKFKWNIHLWTGFWLLQIQTGWGPFLDCIILSQIKSIVVFGSWLWSYHKYRTYLAISHTNVEIPMELSELTRLGSTQFGYGRRTVVQSTPKRVDCLQQVLGCGWVYLATEGIISLASLTESLKFKWNGHLWTGFWLLQIQTGWRPFLDCIILSSIKSIVVFGSWLGSYHKYGTYYLAISH
jgi:hypothetical protein